MAGKLVIVPSQAVQISGEQRLAWFEIDTATGDTIGVLDDGSHGILEGVASFLARFLPVWLVQFGLGYLTATLELSVLKIAKDFLLTAAIKKLGFEDDKAAALVSLLGLLAGATALVESFEFRLPLFVIGYGLGIAQGLYGLLKDPEVPGMLLDPNGTQQPLTNTAFAEVDKPANTAPGAVAANIQTGGLEVQGDLQASWNTPAGVSTSLRGATLNVASGSIQLVGGGSIRTGGVSLAPGASVGVATSVTGAAAYRVAGNGSLGFYGPATTNLGASGDWSSYTASVIGSVTIDLTTDSLLLNGVLLPAGTYRITTTAATLGGSGHSSSPNFVGSATINASNSLIQLRQCRQSNRCGTGP